MTIAIPEAFRDLLEKPAVVSIVTAGQDGKPHAAGIWRKYEDGHLWMSTGRTSRKVRNIRANPEVSVIAFDSQNPYRYLEIGGTAEIVEYGATELLDELSVFYVGKPFFGVVAPAEAAAQYDGVVIKVTLTRFTKYDYPLLKELSGNET
jgi:PPOX class probable F420-dependent enzyme